MELLVVMAIMSTLVVLIVPSIQGGREAARRGLCADQVRQMALALQDHEHTQRSFPSGGLSPWPRLEDFIADGGAGAPYGPNKQGLSWAFQILPYVEAKHIYNLKTQLALDQAEVPLFACPSRSGVRRSPFSGAQLLDYVAAVPSRRLAERPATPNWLVYNAAWGVQGCARSEADFWSTTSGGNRYESDFNIIPSSVVLQPKGVIVRTGYCVRCTNKALPWLVRIRMESLEDGASNILVLGEKRLQPRYYSTGDWHDDRGWSDGWDNDTMRSSFCPPAPDSDVDGTSELVSALAYSFGGSHRGYFNGGFADASVRPVRFNVDVEVLNNLAHRYDGAEVGVEDF